MTQSKSPCRSLLKVLALMPLLAAIILLPGCDSTTTEFPDEAEATDSITIEIVHDDDLLVNGVQMNISELENYLSALPESPDLVRLKVNLEATFGVITDVQTLLRKYEALRINYSTNKDEESSVITLPPASSGFSETVKTENLIQIFMNSQGHILINENSTELNEVKENIKQLLKNESTDATGAIISIKTVPNTPYDKYLSMLDEVKSAYSELKDEAAQYQFGTTFSKLEKNSSEKKMINKMYPEKISIRPPIQD